MHTLAVSLPPRLATSPGLLRVAMSMAARFKSLQSQCQTSRSTLLFPLATPAAPLLPSHASHASRSPVSPGWSSALSSAFAHPAPLPHSRALHTLEPSTFAPSPSPAGKGTSPSSGIVSAITAPTRAITAEKTTEEHPAAAALPRELKEFFDAKRQWRMPALRDATLATMKSLVKDVDYVQDDLPMIREFLRALVQFSMHMVGDSTVATAANIYRDTQRIAFPQKDWILNTIAYELHENLVWNENQESLPVSSVHTSGAEISLVNSLPDKDRPAALFALLEKHIGKFRPHGHKPPLGTELSLVDRDAAVTQMADRVVEYHQGGKSLPLFFLQGVMGIGKTRLGWEYPLAITDTESWKRFPSREMFAIHRVYISFGNHAIFRESELSNSASVKEQARKIVNTRLFHSFFETASFSGLTKSSASRLLAVGFSTLDILRAIMWRLQQQTEKKVGLFIQVDEFQRLSYVWKGAKKAPVIATDKAAENRKATHEATKNRGRELLKEICLTFDNALASQRRGTTVLGVCFCGTNSELLKDVSSTASTGEYLPISLPPLSLDGVQQLINEKCDERFGKPYIVQQVFAATGGIPRLLRFWIEELQPNLEAFPSLSPQEHTVATIRATIKRFWDSYSVLERFRSEKEQQFLHFLLAESFLQRAVVKNSNATGTEHTYSGLSDAGLLALASSNSQEDQVTLRIPLLYFALLTKDASAITRKTPEQGNSGHVEQPLLPALFDHVLASPASWELWEKISGGMAGLRAHLLTVLGRSSCKLEELFPTTHMGAKFAGVSVSLEEWESPKWVVLAKAFSPEELPEEIPGKTRTSAASKAEVSRNKDDLELRPGVVYSNPKGAPFADSFLLFTIAGTSETVLVGIQGRWADAVAPVTWKEFKAEKSRVSRKRKDLEQRYGVSQVYFVLVTNRGIADEAENKFPRSVLITQSELESYLSPNIYSRKRR